jgi:MSHA biogenesis protein MshK
MRATTTLLALACIAGASLSTAQTLRDPTRPPATGGKGGATRSEPPGWVLQSVLISPERRYAIINGEIVQIGGSIDGAELIAVAAERVTLRTRQGLRVLRLFPDVARLGEGDAGTGVTKQKHPPEAGQDDAAHQSGKSGTTK